MNKNFSIAENMIVCFGQPVRVGSELIGRRYAGLQQRFDLSKGMPAIDAGADFDEVDVVGQVLFYIGGQTNIQFLHQAGGVHTLDHLAIDDTSISKFFDRMIDLGMATPEQKLGAMGMQNSASIGEVGSGFGFVWRHWPLANRQIPALAVQLKFEDLPSDFVGNLRKVFDQIPPEQRFGKDFEEWAVIHYYSAVDQLNEMVHKLKQGKTNGETVILGHNPEYSPIAGLEPFESVISNRAAITPNTLSIQANVTEGSDRTPAKLDLVVSIREMDFYQNDYHVTFYSLLLNLLAHVADLQPGELILHCGVTTLYFKNDGQTEQRSVQLQINPDQKDLFALVFDDIRLSTQLQVEQEAA